MAKGERKERQRGLNNEKRSEIVRERVLDYLNFMGGRRGPEYMERAREDFVNAAVRVATRIGMRMWKDGTHPPIEGARSSIAVLLKEKKVVQKGMVATGVNAAWVLDIWEATLDHLTRESVFGRPTPPPDPADLVDPFDGRDPVTGIQIVQPAPRVKPLPTRVLEAYLSGDQEEIMQVAIEVEQLEAKLAAALAAGTPDGAKDAPA